MAIREFAAAAALIGLLTGCATGATPEVIPAAQPAWDDWVVVTYDDTVARFDVDLMDALFDTEIAADEALQASGIGAIDGNDIGEHQYNLYFVGEDSDQMWKTLEPIFDAAPVHWTGVELRHGFDDAEPALLVP